MLTSGNGIASNAVLTNIRIQRNANISFGNSVQFNGVIVTDNQTAGTLASNQIILENGVRVRGVENLNPSAFPASERIAELWQLAGPLILAPGYHLEIRGGTRTYAGALVASQLDLSNGYKGTITGTLINLGSTTFDMMGGGKITFTGGATSVPGLYGGNSFAVDQP